MYSVRLGVLLAAVTISPAVQLVAGNPSTGTWPGSEIFRCTMAPAKSKLLLRIDRDTTLPNASAAFTAMSYSGVPRSAYDSLLAKPDTPMPAARVSLLQADSATRAELRALGVADSVRVAYIRAAPYRADCQTIRYTDSLPWVVVGDTGFARAQLTPREQWVNSVPVFVIRAVWEYPFPRQAASIQWYAPLARRVSASAMYSFESTVASGESADGLYTRDDNGSRAKALAWARANPEEAEGEPIRQTIRQSVLMKDMALVRKTPSRLRGTYRVTMTSGPTQVQWVFRTVSTAAYSWSQLDSARSTASVVANPHVAGTRLVGYAADSIAILPADLPRGSAMRTVPLVWVSTTNRPSATGDDTARTFQGELMFRRTAAPVAIWDALDAYVSAPSTSDSIAIARIAAMNNRSPREEQQPRIPMTWSVDQNGVVRGTSIAVHGERRLEVVVEMVNSVAY